MSDFKKDFKKYKAFIIDFDGTLYPQFPVRAFMAFYLIFYYIIHPFKIRELLFLSEYRRLREMRFGVENDNFNDLQVKTAAMRHNLSPENALKIIDSWMNKRPLKLIKILGRKKFFNFIKDLKNSGVKIIIYSDYPVTEKLAAINLLNYTDYAFWSGDELIKCMKPDSYGLNNIIKLINLDKSEIIYIGDRDNRDGLCAKDAGIDYININEFKNYI